MLQREFDTQVQRLRNHYSDKTYTSEFVRLLWNSMKNLEDGVFRRTVDELIANLRHPPLVPEFIEVARRITNMSSQVIKLVRRSDCEECNGHGYFEMRHADHNFATVASCEKCPAGAELRARDKHAIVGRSKAEAEGYTKKRNFYFDDELNKLEGLPTALHGLCLMIKNNQADSGAFKIGCSFLRLSGDDVWAVYTAYVEKKHSLPHIQAIINRVRARAGIVSTLVTKRIEVKKETPNDNKTNSNRNGQKAL